ncbi:chitin deacetylase 8-like [Hydra vulgaris]|uniref:chitin deacetylase 8-like n=1 Tax=Hydra vulgaris TaxID=6087 RepID=UPI00019268AC|nr:chitin deacetylase 8-like [Hydra vulgaris]
MLPVAYILGVLRLISTQTIENNLNAADDVLPTDITNAVPTTVYQSDQPSNGQAFCNSILCRLPTCRCTGTDIPGGLFKNNTPQVILLTFGDSVTSQNVQLYKDLLEGVTNFNGCPIKATFFVSGDNANYTLVKTLYESGHELADHSVSQRVPPEWWSANATVTELESEIVGQQKAIQSEVGVITKGWRNPYLESTETTFRILADNGFLYDSSLVTFPGVRWWPYTFDYLPSLNCYLKNCPTNFYPGLWEVPIVTWQCDASGAKFGSTMSDCVNLDDEESVYQMIMTNFKLHYDDNKQPFSMFTDSIWFDNKPSRKSAVIRFINDVRKLNDVFFVTIQDLLLWMQSPIGLENFPFSCNR